MWAKIAAFEFRYQVISALFLVVTILFFLLSFGNITSDNVQIAAVGNVNLNSPDAIAQIHLTLSLIALFVVTAFLANIVLRDHDQRTAEMMFATRMSKRDYLLGRFTGAYLAVLLAFSAVPIGMLLGSLMPGLDSERLGPLVAGHYLYAFLVLAAPNILFAGAFAFSLATLSRSLLLTYIGVIAFILLYSITQTLLSEPEWRSLAALLDPFGIAAYNEVTRYWTAFERNAQLAPLDGVLILNRLLWLAGALLLIAFTYWRFRFELPAARRSGRAATAVTTAPVTVASLPRKRPPPLAPWKQFSAYLRFETAAVLRSLPFVILVALAVLTTLFSYLNLNQFFGTAVYPVTRVLTSTMQGTFTLSLIIVVIYYAAEIVWRERQYGIHEMIDATPMPNWVIAGGKTLTLLAVLAILLGVGIVVSALYQWSQGYHHFEWGVYLSRHLLDYGSLFFFAAILSIFIQTLVDNKFIGMALMVVYVVVVLFSLDSLGFEDPLYQFGTRADVAYSDMNGWGHYARIAISYGLYWSFACILLYLLSYLLWRRGASGSLRLRLRQAPSLAGPGSRRIGLLALAGLLLSGGYIYYNTHVLNAYQTQRDIELDQVAYEEQFRQYEGLAQPRITAVDAAVDLYPEQRRYRIDGSYRLENRTDEPLNEVMVSLSLQAEVLNLELQAATLREAHKPFNVYFFDLQEPLQPGDTLQLEFLIQRHEQGFRHARNVGNALSQGSLNGNGTFVFNTDAFPFIGFDRNFILSDRNTRRRHELEPIDRFADLEDATQLGNSYLRQDSDWIDFNTVVSTSSGQIAIAPGYLQRRWREGTREYFHYQMDAPIQNLFAYLSADYARAHEQWKDIDLEVYYHPDHPYNVDKMMHALKQSLGYFESNFSPYQYRQMRILEFPAFAGNFAVSFPNTVPWSEGLGFIARLEEQGEIDYVFYVAAHEVAHQWWGHQVSSANVQGQTLLVETLAQYSALMVMEQEYGPHLMRRFLKYELDNYLSNRGNEAVAEMPLYRVENQTYVHYRKGSLVMYALKDYLGEERLNQALANFIQRWAYQSDPYPTSLDLLAEIEALAENDQERALIDDLFRRIMLWDLRVVDSEITEREDGHFAVAVTVLADKLEADGQGQETSVPLDMPIDLGVFAANPAGDEFSADDVLYLNKEWLRNGESTFRFTVEQRPAYVGIDPYNKLIDRNTDDNLQAVE
ncbi:MAG: M1 family metallopeptidase [Wenzhouxiangellaceae bacterium]